MPVAVRGGRVRALLYQTPEAAYDPRLHDANFLVDACLRSPGSAWPLPDRGRASDVRAGRPGVIDSTGTRCLCGM